MIPFFFPFNSQNIKRKALSRSIFLSKSKSRKKRENKKKNINLMCFETIWNEFPWKTKRTGDREQLISGSVRFVTNNVIDGIIYTEAFRLHLNCTT